VRPDRKEPLVFKELRALRDHLDSQVPLVLRVQRVFKVRQAIRDHKVPRGHQV
jgi:hypothetical protein